VNARPNLIAVLSAGFMTLSANAHALDILLANRDVPATAGGALVTACSFAAAPGRPLRLAEAVERALCNSPKTRAAWAVVKAQAAGVGVARASYLPTISANWQGVRDNSVTNIENYPALSTHIGSTVNSESVSLNWTLFDFGGREAALNSANEMLAAARALQEATLQSSFASVAKDYYAAQTAIGELDAAEQVELMTRQSMIAAQKRADRGVAPITDALQAQTQHEQAVFGLTRAQSTAQSAAGTLASDMNLAPGTPLEIPSVIEDARIAGNFGASAETLIRDVQDTHPSVRAAQAQYEASLARVVQTRAQGRPTINLVAKYARNNQPQSLGLGMPTYPSSGHDAYIGVQVSIPLFEGFGRQYQVEQAQAQAERQQDALDDARRQVALDIWTSYQSLTGASKNVENSAALLDIAQRSWDAARHRYDAGVGNILELMNTQTALANAKQRRIQALADWDNARIDLASKLGTLGRKDLP
jgi:outer membrane protein